MSLCAVYTRLSKEDKNQLNANSDSDSIVNQKRLLLDYAIANGMEVYRIYADDNYSGATENRPDFQRMIDDAKQKKFSVILCKTQSRFTREVELVEKYINGLFVELNIRFIAVAENLDTNTKSNKKSLQINGLVNEWYLEDLSENVKASMDNLRKQGKCVSSFVCYGYKKDSVDKHKLKIDYAAADVVKRIFKMYMDGDSLDAIAKSLNKDGVLTPTKYREMNKSKFKNCNAQKYAHWTVSTVNYILNNETYTGCLLQGKREKTCYKGATYKKKIKDDWIRVEETHEPIISSIDFKRVQEIKQNKNIRISKGRKHFLSNKLRCMECGYTLKKSRMKHKIYFHCKVACYDKKICKGISISLALLESTILLEFKTLLNQYATIENIELEVFEKERKEHLNILKNEIDSLQEQITAYLNRKKEFYLLKVQEIISTKEYKNQCELLNDEIKELEEKKVHYAKAMNEIEHEKFIKKFAINFKNLTSLNEEFIENFIDYIEVGAIFKEKVIRVHWLF